MSDETHSRRALLWRETQRVCLAILLVVILVLGFLLANSLFLHIPLSSR